MKKTLALILALVLATTIATVCISAENAPSVELGDTDVVTSEQSEAETEKEKGGCRSSVGAGAIAVVAAIGAAVSLSKKED
jgi:uncharacterized protein YxeA